MTQPIGPIATALQELQAGERVALAAVVGTRGSTPQPVGSMVCVTRSAVVVGTLGGGCVEAEVRRRAHAMLGSGRGELLTFHLDHDYGYDDGMLCGGQMEIAVALLETPADARMLSEALAELRAGHASRVRLRTQRGNEQLEYHLRVEPAPRLVIAGAGHISRILADLAVRLGFHTSVIDDRPSLLTTERFPPPVRAVTGEIAATLRDWPIDASTYLVIVTRGHRHDQAALEAVLASPAAYVGMIGSRRKIEVIFGELRRRGARPEDLARVHAPIGLDIGAVTTEEIALSIAAQLTQVRRRLAGPCAVEIQPAGGAEA